MANEITVKPFVTLVLGGDQIVAYKPSKFEVDQTNGRFYQAIHDIGTSEESITSFGDVATPGLVTLLNMDATNYVEWGFATTDYGGHLTANDGSATKGVPFAQFYGLSGMELFLKANTASCKVLVTVMDR